MKKKLVIIQFFISFISIAQPAFVYPRILSKPKQACDNEVKVKDLYTSNCGYEANCNYLYPVLIEEFDYNYDLPNKWRFDLGYTQDDDVASDGKYTTWYGDGYFDNSVWPPAISNHNVQLNNGIATLVNLQESVTRNGKNYSFTSGMIQSLMRFRTGIFEGRIKVPDANKMWPAFWLLNNKSHYAEIDIFEYYDDHVGSNPGSNSNCDTYNLHKMSVHSGASSNDCHRSDKYPQNISNYHDYKLVWNEYEIFIFVDGAFRGYGTKYLRNSTLPFFPCGYGYSGNYFDPAENYSCNQIQSMPDNLLPTIPYIDFGPRPWWLPSWISWPPPQPPQPYLANKLRQDSYFPSKNNAMSIIINNSINRTYKDDDFSNFSQSSLNMEIDWVKVYQPFCCGIDKTVCSLADLDNQTYNTDILTGHKINIGYANNSCNFEQFKPGKNGDWRDIPIVLLATDEIAIQGEAIFAGDTYAEMRITECGQTARMSNSEFAQVDSMYNAQQQISDSLINAYSQKTDSIIKAEQAKYINEYKENYINEASANINIWPIPTANEININCSDELYNKIISLIVVNSNGIAVNFKKDRKINIENLNAGVYELKIVFEDNTHYVKKIVKI